MTIASQHSSGDILADRRADYARMLAEGGDFSGAGELMEQALEISPGWAAGWFRLAEYAEKAGSVPTAATALRRVLELAPEDPFGAGLRLAVLGAAEVPATPPTRYVEQLFDDYAQRFDAALVEKLEYSVPQKLAALVADGISSERFVHVTDLGCGTGLFGERIRARAGFLEGFDLSANMLAKAREKQVYDRLAQADLSLPPPECGVFATGLAPGRTDLASAADVLMYLGELAPVFEIAFALIAPGGHFAFSVEDAASNETYVLRTSLRYAHGKAYVRRRADEAGFDLLQSRQTVIRMDAGAPVTGRLYLARRR
ncbi:class I SAM-dependent DNA methyltransferase [Mycoplana rhizolycopersici]|uniref:Methyltransferase domain-containing protein n=1 Tax=Mycoplana rhizolycopersici TaxID=2746702 RepID=A0ABX2QAX9_9HYPH|nr:methyltransferase [Rhizobium rhizolycopersici]NVP54895.1 methyltransferase domain-containing protein [Rhizobium rhizolycopersici]